jgi:hypothetical protein
MKARKAMKRLQRVETLLGTVIDQYDAVTKEVTTMLDSARASVASASKALAASPANAAPAKAETSARRELSSATRKRLSVAAKKRWAQAKRAGISTLAKPVRKTNALHLSAGAS